MKRNAIITGATSGIGESVARIFAAEGWNLILTGRRTGRLLLLKRELESEHGIDVLVLAFDICDRHQVAAALETLPSKWHTVDILVNNAGLAAGLEHIDEGDVLDWEAMIDTNVKGLLYVTRVVSNMMIAEGGGHIINIGSIAGHQVYENGAVYCATKHAVHALSLGMRADFLRHGIRITEICPGMVETEFSLVRFHGDAERAAKVYEGVVPLSPCDVAEAVLWAVTRPPLVNVDEITITPRQQAGVHLTYRK